MEDKLDFSLPEKKEKAAVATTISIILLLILVGLTSAILVVGPSRKDSVPEATAQALSAEQTKQLATRLAQRNLYRQAAKVWQDYLSAGQMTDPERAKALFQIGTLLEKANLYAEAVEYYYRSEITAPLDELTPQINTRIKDCFEKLGKFSALRYELMDRTSFKKSDRAGSKIVAEIGAEKFTEADLDAVIENDIDNRLSPWAAFMTAEQLNEQKKQMLAQYRSSEAKMRYLQGWLTQEILYREALQEQLAEKPQVKNILNEQARAVLSQHLMNQQLAAKIHITETDLQTYYAANKNTFTEQAKAQIRHILVDDEQQAGNLIDRIKSGEDFAKLAEEFSKDESTKKDGGKIETDVSRGSYVAGIGNLPELNEKIFEADAPSVLDEPFKAEKGWEIVKVEYKQAERQKSFDEVREQVMSTLLSQKREDVQKDYVKRMMDKYEVVVHTSALKATGEGRPEENSAEKQQ
jgi:foldase protein PrsA